MRRINAVLRDARFVLGMIVGGLVVALIVPFVAGDAKQSAVSSLATGTQSVGQASGSSGSAATSMSDTAGITGGGGAAVAADASGATAAGGSDAAAATAGGPAPAAAEATDQGITSDAIKVGIPLIDLGAISATGLAASNGTVSDRENAWRAIIDARNKAGGVAGRKIVPVFAPFGGTDTSAQTTSCQRLAEQKVFFVLADAGWSNLGDLCLTRQFGIPTMAFQSVDASDIQAANGLLFTSLMTNDRILYNHVHSLHDAGLLKGKRIGLVAAEGFNAFDKVEVPELERLGYRIVHRSTLSQDIGTAQSQIPVEVSQMRVNNVDFIIFEGGVIYLNVWANEADKQHYYPAYSMSDFSAGTDDFGLQAVSGRLDAIGWGSRRKLERRGSAPESPDDRACRQIVEPHGVRMDRSKDLYWEVTRYCGQLQAFVTAGTNAGKNLTRGAVAGAHQSLGRMPYFDVGPTGQGGSFVGSKHDAADFLHRLRADTSCRCWRPEGDWLPAKPLGG